MLFSGFQVALKFLKNPYFSSQPKIPKKNHSKRVRFLKKTLFSINISNFSQFPIFIRLNLEETLWLLWEGGLCPPDSPKSSFFLHLCAKIQLRQCKNISCYFISTYQELVKSFQVRCIMVRCGVLLENCIKILILALRF